MKARRALDETSERLATAGCDSPRVDAEILVSHVLACRGRSSRSRLRASSRARRRRRSSGWSPAARAREPLAYVLGEWGFRRLTLGVDRRVLVPRPETEIVVERCLARIAGLDRAARPRRRDGERSDRARDRGRASGRARDRDRRVAGRARGRRGERAPDGARDRAARVGSVHGAPRRAVGSRRLEPSLRPARGDRDARARGSRLGAAGGARRRGGDRGRRARSGRRTSNRAARSSSRLRRGTPRGSRRCSRPGLRRRRDDAGSRRTATGSSRGRADRELLSTTSSQRSTPGELVVIPTDTVYGLACRPDREDAVRALSALKRRSPEQPIALVAASVEALRRADSGAAGATCFFGARSRSSSRTPRGDSRGSPGARPDTIGVRVPDFRRRGGRCARARRRRGGDEREPARRPRSPPSRRRSGGDPRRRRGRPRRRRVAGRRRRPCST